MKITKEQLLSEGSKLGIEPKQLALLWNALAKNSPPSGYLKVLFFLGAMMVIAAMTWFLNLSWAWYGSGIVFLVAAAYAALFLGLGAHFWKKEGLELPGGLLITMAVCMVPLMIYALQNYFGAAPPDDTFPYFFRKISGEWLVMDLGTILAGLAALYYFRFPFLTAPISVAVWFMTMDLVPYFFGTELSLEQKAWISAVFGLLLTAIALLIDEKSQNAYGFWLSLFGALTFWGAAGTLLWDQGEFKLALYLIINLLMMTLAIPTQRSIFIILGGIGTFAYLYHIADVFFKDSLAFPLILSFIGLALIYLGILYQRFLLKSSKKL